MKNLKEIGKFDQMYKKLLKNAVQEKVVMRFAPEPNGHLHIGHAKAVFLAKHFTKAWNGKLILRFDDTNPKKEKTEFSESIKKTLDYLEITFDNISYTSDYFKTLINYCEEGLKKGFIYCDDTPEDLMKKQRTLGIKSVHRDNTIEQNFELWEQLLKGENKQFCVRAKIDYSCTNKCMRDPVIYRSVDLPHQRTENQFKIYPTYDFSCPLVDSFEKITHSSRSNEYADRNPQFQWFLEKFYLPKIEIFDFSRLNFVSTPLSKRQMTWFIENNYVESWNDPRLPTISGITRRGLRKEALEEFILGQGPSKNTNLMEWDKIWAINRKLIDDQSPRLTAIQKKGIVSVKVDGLLPAPIKLVPFHKKNEQLGQKPVFVSEKIFIENEDAINLKNEEKIVLMDLGVFITKVCDVSKSIVFEFDPNENNFNLFKKIAWLLNDLNTIVPVNVYEFDHLITCQKLPENANISDFLNLHSKFKDEYFCESIIQTFPQGTIIQILRRGFFIIDKKHLNGEIDLIYIPDGKSKMISKLYMNTKADKSILPAQNIQEKDINSQKF